MTQPTQLACLYSYTPTTRSLYLIAFALAMQALPGKCREHCWRAWVGIPFPLPDGPQRCRMHRTPLRPQQDNAAAEGRAQQALCLPCLPQHTQDSPEHCTPLPPTGAAELTLPLYMGPAAHRGHSLGAVGTGPWGSGLQQVGLSVFQAACLGCMQLQLEGADEELGQ